MSGEIFFQKRWNFSNILLTCYQLVFLGVKTPPQQIDRMQPRDGLRKKNDSVTSLKCIAENIINLFEKALKMMKNGVYSVVITLLVAELSKIVIYANYRNVKIQES